MSGFFRKYPWRIKPSIPKVDWKNPINRGLSAWYLAYEGAGTKLRNIALKNDADMTSVPWVVSPTGHALSLNGTSGLIDFGFDTRLKPGTSSFTWMFDIDYVSDGGSDIGEIFSDRQLGAIGTASGVIMGKAGASASPERFAVVLEATNGDAKNYNDDDFWAGSIGTGYHTLTVTWDNPSDSLLIYLDRADVTSGFTKGTDTSLVGDSITSNQNVFISHRPGAADNRKFEGRIRGARLFKRALTPKEIASIHDSKHLLGLAPQSAFVPTAVESTKSPTTGILRFLGGVPGTAAVIEKTKSPGLGILNFIGGAPEVVSGQAKNKSPTTGILSFLGGVPDAQSVIVKTKSPSLGVLEFLGGVPGVDATGPVTKSPSTGILSFIGGVPQASGGAILVTKTPTTGVLSFIGGTMDARAQFWSALPTGSSLWSLGGQSTASWSLIRGNI